MLQRVSQLAFAHTSSASRGCQHCMLLDANFDQRTKRQSKLKGRLPQIQQLADMCLLCGKHKSNQRIEQLGLDSNLNQRMKQQSQIERRFAADKTPCRFVLIVLDKTAISALSSWVYLLNRKFSVVLEHLEPVSNALSFKIMAGTCCSAKPKKDQFKDIALLCCPASLFWDQVLVMFMVVLSRACSIMQHPKSIPFNLEDNFSPELAIKLPLLPEATLERRLSPEKCQAHGRVLLPVFDSQTKCLLVVDYMSISAFKQTGSFQDPRVWILSTRIKLSQCPKCCLAADAISLWLHVFHAEINPSSRAILQCGLCRLQSITNYHWLHFRCGDLESNSTGLAVILNPYADKSVHTITIPRLRSLSEQCLFPM